MNKNILVVVAHPDDEVLGCGGTIAKYVHQGFKVHVAYMADGVSSRDTKIDNDENIRERNVSADNACQILGVQPVYFNFPDNRMDTVALLDIVQSLEKLISKIEPSIIYTHHHSDLNIDHRLTYQAVMTACRPEPSTSVKEIYSFEVSSSTDWSTNSEQGFKPTMACDITKYLDKKIEALMCYEQEMREFPHSRSIDAVKYLVKSRGAQFGLSAAEVFTVERLIIL